jgi:hypothetical protein
MKLWKALGLAGLAGVAAGGVIIARDQRQRAQLTPEEIRARLRERAAQGQDAAPDQGPGTSGSTDSSARA